MSETALEELFDAAGLDMELANRWSEKAKSDGQSIDQTLVESGVLDPVAAQTFRTILKGYATIDPASIARDVDLEQARGLAMNDSGAVISLVEASEPEPTPSLPPTAPPPRLPSVPVRTRVPQVGPVPIGFGAPEAWIGTDLGPYTLRRFIGEGSTARVYEAEHRLLNVRRVLKIPARGADSSTLLAEARLLERVSHPGVAPFLEFDIDHGCPFVVLRWQHGQCLSERLVLDGPCDESMILKVATDVADVLDFCHERGILHLDVKPENLFVGDGRVLVLDFGVAAVRDDVLHRSHFYGTPMFAAPEQVASPESVDARTDLYGLGMTLYAAALGQDLQRGDGLFGHFFEERAPLREHRPDFSPGLCALIDALIRHDRDLRPSSAADLRARLVPLNPSGEESQ
ncbi:MAG: serine/threonine-protein kinase [Myxococcota bacterium]